MSKDVIEDGLGGLENQFQRVMEKRQVIAAPSRSDCTRMHCVIGYIVVWRTLTCIVPGSPASTADATAEQCREEPHEPTIVRPPAARRTGSLRTI